MKNKSNNMKNSCKHQKLIEVKTSMYNHYTGEDHIEENWVWEDTFEDIDLHRYKCTQCGEIHYYSGAAKAYYTKGTENPTLGPTCD